MSLVDEQLLQLEAYLDGALAPDEADAVRQLLASDPDWVTACERLRADRTLRQSFFAGLEPGRDEADRFTARLVAAIETQGGKRRRYGRIFRMSSAVAACLTVGVLGGWLLRGRSIALDHPVNATVAARPAGHAEPKVAEVVAYQVELTDEAGRVTAIQRFDSLDKAREFADDLSRWQERQRQMRNGAAVVVADKF